MLLILFGLPGVGKSYLGQLLATHYDFHCYEADENLTPAMIAAIHQQQIFTPAMREEFFTIVIQKIQQLQKHHTHIVVTQGLAKECNRLQLLRQCPSAQFIHVVADESIALKRLQQRNDWISVAYARKIRDIAEAPRLSHHVIENNSDTVNLQKQLDRFLQP